ncbi:hypothetical protein BCU83_18265 [Vibrio breoganii]|uniref:NifB/NifX family molybdenum-iron cluster-binding protein n=1 Tax=Vibrio breoganii TaxID=553239 RepID=UPI000C867441|nr:NifB/NifX family molybdenum-iron cluster-binding protein [Vibrio breoganii]PMG85576.1 hypothetical protein BCU83_18265 [Vibrio breoganii]
MIYAIPCLNQRVGNHFSRSPEITIIDDQKRRLDTIALDESDQNCSKHKRWMAIIKHYKVDAVVVRHIGTNMLGHLFKQNIRVFTSPAKAEIDQLQLDHLTEVSDIAYGREPRNRTRGCRKDSKPNSIFKAQANTLGAIRRIHT